MTYHRHWNLAEQPCVTETTVVTATSNAEDLSDAEIPGRPTMKRVNRLGPRLRASIVAGVLAFAAVACNQLVLRTAVEPAIACDAALTAGRLVSSRESGLALRPADGGPNIPVTWPFGYSAGGFVGDLELRDETGRVLAREGDFIQVGGGMGGDDAWVACAGSVSIIPAPG